MTDETSKNRLFRRGAAGSNGGEPQESGPALDAGSAAPTGDDPDVALERLQSMSSSARARPAHVAATPAVPPPVAKRGAPRSRSRRAAASVDGRSVARLVAPVVFLVAVVVLLGIVIQSGVVGGTSDTAPTPAATSTKQGNSGSNGTKKYVVKSGDTLSGIALRFDTSVSNLKELNPELSATTLVIGTRIVVPRK